jgi:co-chaperonin GroES (HSP10)
MNFRPLHDRILVRRIDREEKSESGLVCPEAPKNETPAPATDC